MKSKMMVSAAFVLFLAAGSTAAIAESAFLCISAQSTGFAYDKAQHEWTAARFAAGKKYIIWRVTPDTMQEFEGGARMPLRGAVWAVWEFGNDKLAYAPCEKDFDSAGTLFCKGSTDEDFRFNRKTGRYIIGWLIGYTSGPIHLPGLPGQPGQDLPEGSNTPFLEIGNCSSI